jgi:hypothetical protein
MSGIRRRRFHVEVGLSPFRPSPWLIAYGGATYRGIERMAEAFAEAGFGVPQHDAWPG